MSGCKLAKNVNPRLRAWGVSFCFYFFTDYLLRIFTSNQSAGSAKIAATKNTRSRSFACSAGVR